MFGLMKNTGDALSKEQPDWYRLHYCGTCKALGRIYGQRSRAFLNYDLVFLSEFLSLVKEADTRDWSSSLQSHNCFSLPGLNQLPIELEYAADINAVFIDLKIKDNIEDNSSMLWKIISRILQKPLGRIGKRMSRWNIDYQLLQNLQAEDIVREEQAKEHKNLEELLSWHGAPSAQISAYLFSKGANAIGRPDLEKAFYDIGYAFGELIYFLDAWQDRAKDEENQEFNPLLKITDLGMEEIETEARELIWQKADLFSDLIQNYPIKVDKLEALQSRFKLNIAAALGKSPKVCSPKSGIENSTVPQAFKKLGQFRNKISDWINPLRPGRFVISYMVLLLVFFHEQLFAVGSAFQKTENVWGNALFLSGILLFPPLLYFIAKDVKKKRARWQKKLDRKKKRLLKKLRRAERKASEKPLKKKWWFWALVILGGIVVIAVTSALLSSGSGGGCGGSGCGDCDCGCGDCGDCNCDCNC